MLVTMDSFHYWELNPGQADTHPENSPQPSSNSLPGPSTRENIQPPKEFATSKGVENIEKKSGDHRIDHMERPGGSLV